MGPLHDYEFSRESGAFHEQVNFIRFGQIPGPTYWSPSPSFGWSEWPLHSYLSVPAEERLRRLQLLAAINYDELRALPARPPITGPPASGKVIKVYLDGELSPLAQSEAVWALLRVEGHRPCSPRKMAQGRASAAARRFDRIRSLSAARLLQLYPAAEALEMMNEAHQKLSPEHQPVFCDVSTLRRASRRAYQYLVEFMLLAEHQIRSTGLWPPPFGNTLVDL
jgi:hypothetical protein